MVAPETGCPNHDARSERANVQPVATPGAYNWISEAVRVLKAFDNSAKGREEALRRQGYIGEADAIKGLIDATEELLRGVPVPPEDLGFNSPADRYARAWHALNDARFDKKDSDAVQYDRQGQAEILREFATRIEEWDRPITPDSVIPSSLRDIADTLDKQHYIDAEHEHLGCPTAKTGIYAERATNERIITKADKHAAFEWLRGLALDDNQPRHAAVAFQEWEKLARSSTSVSEQVAGRPRGAYVPLTVAQVDSLRHDWFHGAIGGGYRNITSDEFGTLCNMAINALLYGEEIERLRSASSKSDKAEG